MQRDDPFATDAPTRAPDAEATVDEDALRAAFDRHDGFRLGVEEELMLLDAATLELAAAAPRLVAAVADPRVARELIASQVETVTPVCATAEEARAELLAARRLVAAGLPSGVVLAAAGTAPLAAGPFDVTPGARYRAIAHEVGWVATHLLPFGQHVHVSVPGSDRALAVFNALRAYLPELLALGANSPFTAGTDAGVASVRATLNSAYPRSGPPPALASWGHFARLVAWGRRVGAFPDPTYLWWDARLNLEHGTIEVRVLDAQTTAEDAAALAGVVHALAHRLATCRDEGRPLPRILPEVAEENRFRALRHGLRGTLIDPVTGDVEPTRERVRAVLADIEESATAVGAAAALAHARAMLAGNGAERQRAIAEARGIDGAARWLVERAREELGAP